MRIANNLMAMNAHRQLVINQGGIAKSIEKLSSGLRINRAGDDAAGLAISEKMRGQIRGLKQAMRNAQDGISLIQTAEGALQETHAMLQRIRELVVQANNSTNTTSDLEEIQKEISQLADEITRIAEKTEFNTKTLLDGSLGVKASGETVEELAKLGVSVELSGVGSGKTITLSVDINNAEITATMDGISQTIQVANTIAAGTQLNFDDIGLKLTFAADTNLNDVNNAAGDIETVGTPTKFQIGANRETTLEISIANMRADALGKDVATSGAPGSIADINVAADDFNFDATIEVVDKAIGEVSAQRSQLGAWQNRLEHTINNLGVSAENLQAAESRIRDVDMAQEMMNFTKFQILQQASTAMLAQANLAPQSVLQLLG